MPRLRNDTGSVLSSTEFGSLPPGEFDLDSYDPAVHGVIPGCVLLDPPAAGDSTPPGTGDTAGAKGRKRAADANEQDKETAA